LFLKKHLLTFYIISLASFANAQNNADSLHKLKKIKALGFPVLSYTPETRVGYGVAGVGIFRLGNAPAETKPSQVSVGIGLTQNHQQLYYLPFTIYTNKNKYYIYGEAGYYNYNYYFYGIGQTPIPKELYYANYPRIRLTALKLIAPHYYAGIRYQYENYKIVQTTAGGELASGIIPGSNGSNTSGAGIVQIYDKRDSVLYPTKGYWMELTAVINPTLLGSSANFQQYSFDATAYKKISKKIVWANELFTKIVSGNAPFSQYAILGGNRKMRGFYEGQYRDKNALVLQTEFRALIYKRFGAAVFGSAGFIGGDDQYVDFGKPKATYGAGFRYIVDRTDHLNLRLDYAIGNGTGQFYATFGEAL
jgi:outer membrane protein assembly factor BamA